MKGRKRRGAIDSSRAKAALAKLDALVEAHPKLTSPQAQARLAEVIKESETDHGEVSEAEKGKAADRGSSQRVAGSPRLRR